MILRLPTVSAALFLALLAPALAQQPDREQVDQFLRFLRTTTYSELLAQKALDTDVQMPPECSERELVGRELFAVTRQPRFIETREVPIEGAWAERVTIERCGRRVEHNIYFFASRVRGLHAVAGFPGRTLTEPQLQFEVARDLLGVGRRLAPQCETFDVVETRIVERPDGPTRPWTERWSLYMCGRVHEQTVRFIPDNEGRTGFRLQD